MINSLYVLLYFPPFDTRHKECRPIEALIRTVKSKQKTIFEETSQHTLLYTNPHYNFDFLNVVLSILVPSSSCSATSSTGNSAGIILRGVAPGTREY